MPPSGWGARVGRCGVTPQPLETDEERGLQSRRSEVSAGSEERTRRAARADLALERDAPRNGRAVAAGGERAKALHAPERADRRPWAGVVGAEQRSGGAKRRSRAQATATRG